MDLHPVNINTFTLVFLSQLLETIFLVKDRNLETNDFHLIGKSCLTEQMPEFYSYLFEKLLIA